MKTKKKVIFALLGACLIFITCLTGLIFYLHGHPSASKSLIEAAISRSTGTSVRIEALWYELKPLSIEAKGIVIVPPQKGDEFHLEIPELRATFALEGSFGRRSLILESLTINGFTLNISKKTSLPRMERQPTILGRVLERLTEFFLFREVRFQGVEVAGGEISARFGDQTIQLSGLRAVLNAEHLLEISCSTRMERLGENLSLSIPDLQITTNQAISFADPEIHCLLTAKQGVLQSPGPKVGSMDVRAEVVYFHSSKKLTFSPLNLHLTGLTLGLESLRDPGPMELDLSTSGRFSLEEAQLSDCRFQLTVTDVVELDGEITGQFTGERSVEVKLLNGEVIPQKLVDTLPAEMSRELSPMALSGLVGLRGRINGRREQERWKWDCELLSELEDNHFSYNTTQIHLSSDLAGEIGIKGAIPSLAITATLKTKETSFSTNGIELKPFGASLSLSGTYPRLEVENIVADIPLVKLTLGEKNIDIEGVQLTIKQGSLNGKRRSLSLPKVMLTTSLLKNLFLSLEAEGKHLTIVLKGQQVDLVKSAQALSLIPSNWQLDGRDRIQLKATVKEDGDLLFVSKLSLVELAFQNQEGTSMGEGITIETEVDGQGRLVGGPQITLNVSVKADGGEILHDRYYLDLNNNAFFSSGEVRYVAPHRSVELAEVRVGLEDILALDLGGTISFRDQNPRVYLAINAPRTSLQPIFQQFVLEPFKSESPLLTTLNLEGEISANLDLSRDGTGWKAKGQMVWLDGKLWQDEKTLSLEGINIDLPVWYQARGGELEEETVRGELSIQSMLIPHLPEQSLQAQLEVRPNTLSVKSPTILMVPGGKAQFGPLVANNLFSSNGSVTTSLEMKAIDITSLLAGIWPGVPKGIVNARLEPIHLERDMISSSGQVQLNVFDGEIILSDLGASGLLTPAPLFKLDVEVKDLSLAALTTGTSFGKIEGVLRGHVKDLEVANGQPQGFDLLLETVERKGMDQKISLKAVDNIAQIGGAQSPFMGTAGFFTSFFNLLPYKKIGVESSLINDVFRINGTVKEGGKEYLVKRGGLSGVNIINQSPDNRISFKDMVKRIKRITAKSRGGVVK